jgi:hypothetical protein
VLVLVDGPSVLKPLDKIYDRVINTRASEAEIASTIPQTATVDRSKARLTVNYEGDPNFASIHETTLQYARASKTDKANRNEITKI